MERGFMMNQNIFIYITLGFIAGVGAHSLISFNEAFILLVFLFGLAFVLCSYVLKEKRFGMLALLSLTFISFGIGLARYHVSLLPHSGDIDRQAIGRQIQATGIVTQEPDERENSTLLTLSLKDVSFSGASSKIDEKILAIVPRYPEFSYGDKIGFDGVLQFPQNFETQGGKLFDYRAYLLKDDIRYTSFHPKLALLEHGDGNILVAKLLELKSLFLQKTGIYIKEPEMSLLGGLLVGAKHGLPADVQTSFRNAGLVHMIVLSGYNITIVAEFIMALFFFLLLRYRLIFGSVGIILFAIMTGGAATVIRASIMALLVILAKATGRTYNITRALLLAALVMIFVNPKILIFDPSFELSFLATVGLVYVTPIVESLFKRAPASFGIREILVSTAATQVLVLPLLLFMTGSVSVISFVSNILVLPFIPLTMLLGFLTGVLAFLHPLLSFPFSYATYLLLHYEIWVATFLGNLPWASISISYFGALALLLSYAFLGALLIFAYSNKKPQSVR